VFTININDYYLNPNIDGDLEEFILRKILIYIQNTNIIFNTELLTKIAIMDCIDGAIDENNEEVFNWLINLLYKLNIERS